MTSQPEADGADEKKPPRQNIRIEGESNVSKNGGMWAGVTAHSRAQHQAAFTSVSFSGFYVLK